MQNYRTRLRDSGLRPVQIWVPDQRVVGFKESVAAQIAQLNAREEREILEFVEHTSDWLEE